MTDASFSETAWRVIVAAVIASLIVLPAYGVALFGGLGWFTRVLLPFAVVYLVHWWRSVVVEGARIFALSRSVSLFGEDWGDGEIHP